MFDPMELTPDEHTIYRSAVKFANNIWQIEETAFDSSHANAYDLGKSMHDCERNRDAEIEKLMHSLCARGMLGIFEEILSKIEEETTTTRDDFIVEETFANLPDHTMTNRKTNQK
jgi:hypothetical protein